MILLSHEFSFQLCKVKILGNKGFSTATLSLKYLQHRFTAGYRNGFGIHSPYLYDLVRNVIFNQQKQAVPDYVQQLHSRLKKDRQILELNEIGAGSRVTQAGKRTVSSIARGSSVTSKQGALLFRICKWYAPSVILEFGTGLGISTAYLAAGSGGAPVITVEGCKTKHLFAVGNMIPELAPKIEFLEGDFTIHFSSMLKKVEERALVFIDGDHRYLPTMDKVTACLKKENIKEVMLILDDIYWSKEMEKAWDDCISMEMADISLDLFHFGLLIKRGGIARQHFKIKFQ